MRHLKCYAIIAAAMIHPSSSASAADRWPMNPGPQATSYELLFYGYQLKAFVQYCHERRRGYAVQYVNDYEYDEARIRAFVLTEKLLPSVKADSPSFNSDAEYGNAVKSISGMWMSPQTCRISYDSLIRLTGGVDLKKDF